MTKQNRRKRANKKEAAKVIALPPIIYAAVFIAGLVLNRMFRGVILQEPSTGDVVGGLMLGAGLFLMAWAVRTFSKGGENPDVRKPTNKILSSGPYAFSRNPMYVSMTLAYVGIALIVNVVWPLVFLPVAFIVLHYGVVLREEQYLERKFGDEYRRYKSKVRRHI